MDEETKQHAEEIHCELFFARKFFLEQNNPFLGYLMEMALLEMREQYSSVEELNLIFNGEVNPTGDVDFEEMQCAISI